MGRDIAALVAGLSTDDKARLTTGRDAWSTAPLEAAGIPPVGMTDGPNGARGSAVLGAGEARSACVPCGSALGATWNPELIERVGTLLGEETRLRGARVLLAPTVNLHRSPLAGRNFECFSEDPLLSGRAAAAYVRGVQACGVAVTVKHLVGNEAETERYTMNSVIDPRALRELYLVPFELAVKEGGALGVMTSYNRFNGGYCANDAALLNGILRGEWGFEGFVVSDWYAVVSTIDAARAGLDLEMPGPGRAYGARLAAAVAGGDVPEADLDAAAGRLLGVFDRLGALDDPPEQEERFEDRPEHRAIAREAATESIVLLRNEGVLPLEPGSLRSLAVVGPNAERAQLMGGGSAKLRPYYRVAPLDAIRERFGAGVDVRHERGVDIDRTVPELPAPFRYEVFAGTELAGEPVRTGEREDGLLMFFRAPAEVPDPEAFSMRARGSFTAEAGGVHEFTLVLAGSGRLLVDGSPVVEAAAPPPGGEFFRMASDEISGTLELAAGQTVELVLEWSSPGAVADFKGAKVGCRPPLAPDALDRAVAAAAEADAAIVVVGTNDDWETEGRDRASMDLPGDQNELVERVLAANPRTVVVVNAGSPVTLPWADRAPALLDVWFGGQEMAGRAGRRAGGRRGPVRPASDDVSGRRRAQPVARQLPGRERRVPLRRGRAHRIPLVRGAPVAGPLPVRPRPLLHLVRAGRPARRRPRAGRGGGRRDEHGHAARRRGRAVLRRARGAAARAPAEGAQGLRQGLAGAGRDDDRAAGTGRARVRLLGPGRPGSRGAAVDPGGLALGGGRRTADAAGLAHRSRPLRRARRAVLRRHRPRGRR